MSEERMDYRSEILYKLRILNKYYPELKLEESGSEKSIEELEGIYRQAASKANAINEEKNKERIIPLLRELFPSLNAFWACSNI